VSIGPPQVLCVDDEPRVLEGLRGILGRRYAVLTAESGQRGLELIAQAPRIAVIISDMRMPGMGGAEFLSRACAALPQAQRIALTGHADLPSAVAAVNRGQVFRFLIKPCPASELLESVDAAVERYHSHLLEQSAVRRAVDLRQFESAPLKSSQSERSAREAVLLQDLREAVERDSLALQYQPVVDVEAQCVRSIEALARWHHPSLGDVSPAEFIGVAERGGEISRLGQWALRRACREARSFDDDRLKIAINVSAHEFDAPSYVAHLAKCLALSGLPAQRLELELTESALAKDIQTLRCVLQELKGMGVTISVDDFGTGYSSLSYLSRLPIDAIKVDQVFVREFDQGGKAIIKAALGIARDFGCKVIIEGVETAEQLTQLRELGAWLIQGYVFARPMAPQEVRGWLQRTRKSFGDDGSLPMH
jgi:EAL domain-containing protein (putative c-di-GMP-specific phosphodiesterase class I)/FixJ family two-component response regulator